MTAFLSAFVSFVRFVDKIPFAPPAPAKRDGGGGGLPPPPPPGGGPPPPTPPARVGARAVDRVVAAFAQPVHGVGVEVDGHAAVGQQLFHPRQLDLDDRIHLLAA